MSTRKQKDCDDLRLCGRLESWWNLCTQVSEEPLRRKIHLRYPRKSHEGITVPRAGSQAKELAAAIAEVSEEELLEIARTLVDAEPADLFGATEFKIRDLAHRIAAKAYERRLAQKKSATRPPG
jgi:hypothetical protein